MSDNPGIPRTNCTSLDIAMPRDYNPGTEQTEVGNVIRGTDGHSPNAESFGSAWDGDPTHCNPRFLDEVQVEESYEPPGIGNGSA